MSENGKVFSTDESAGGAGGGGVGGVGGGTRAVIL